MRFGERRVLDEDKVALTTEESGRRAASRRVASRRARSKIERGCDRERTCVRAQKRREEAGHRGRAKRERKRVTDGLSRS